MLKYILGLLIVTTTSCSISKKTGKQANAFVLQDSALLNANVGISIYDPSTNTYLYNHNANKYFVPASNTKIATCYAAMKYLGDSLVGLRYMDNDTALLIQGTGDPSFLIDEFKQQPVNDFLQKNNKNIVLTTSNWKEEKWGSGWSWTDFGENYCQERSVLPMYYNRVTFTSKYMGSYINQTSFTATPPYFSTFLNTQLVDVTTSTVNVTLAKNLSDNSYYLKPATSKFQTTYTSFSTGDSTTIGLIESNYKRKTQLLNNAVLQTARLKFTKIHSQPTDSVLKPMMHRSDNFFAEQSLLMASNEKLGYMNDAAIIDYLKKNEFANIPQMPRWVDGSGLSRYNMFTPQSLIFILNKMKNEFGMERIKDVFPTGGEGTLSSLYKDITGFIFAKTGTLSNHAALSGFLYTKKNKLLIFSILTSGYQGSATPVRKAVEKFMLNVYQNN